MSTVSMGYPDITRVQRLPAIGRILILGSFVLIAITVLIILLSVADAELPEGTTVAGPSIGPVAVPVPTPPITEIQPVPSETSNPYAPETSEPAIGPVPVPTAPSQ